MSMPTTTAIDQLKAVHRATWDSGDYTDVALSVVGVQFAPRHELAARELARVVRPGGRVVLCSWTPRGFIGQFLKTVAPRIPKPPDGASPPPLWGDQAHV